MAKITLQMSSRNVTKEKGITNQCSNVQKVVTIWHNTVLILTAAHGRNLKQLF
jgi:hypothetical protein